MKMLSRILVVLALLFAMPMSAWPVADGNISSSGSGSSGGPTGNELITDMDEEVESLNDRALTTLTSVAGTNTITASFTPAGS
jgi:hypothetical protein